MNLVDWGVADALLEEVGQEDFEEIAGLLLSEVEEASMGLEALTNRTEITDALHGLKGIVMNLGFQSVVAECEKGEQDAKALDVAALQALIVQSVLEFRSRHWG